MLVGLVGLVGLAWVGSINSRQFLGLFLITYSYFCSYIFVLYMHLFMFFFSIHLLPPLGWSASSQDKQTGSALPALSAPSVRVFWNPNGGSLEKVATWRAPECHEGRVWEAVKWCHLGEPFESIHARRHWKSLTVYGFVQKNGSQLCRNPRWKDIGDGGVDSGASKNRGLDIPGVRFCYTYIS